MPALPSPDSLAASLYETTSTFSSLFRRAPSTGSYRKPGDIGAGVLVVFCLIGASLGLLAWWLFIRRSGFIWRSSDWQDYKASVLRRPGERPDDAITVFSDGTARRGGGSSVGARTVVLGELDTTYTKSRVEKPWGPREQPGKDSPRKKGLLGTVWSDVKGSVWGNLRGGEPSESDTVVQREKSLQRERSRRRRHQHRRRHSSKRKVSRRKEEVQSEVTESFVDTQRPAPPLTDITETNIRRPTRASTRAGKATVTREPSKAAGDDRTARYHRHKRTQSAVTEESSDESSDSSSDSSSSEESDSDDDDASTINQSQLGMAKGNKVYHHPISAEHVFWGNARPVERNGGGAGGTFGGGAPAVMPAPRGYRAASVGSLSSMGSVGSSHAGR
ncbi:hypothetical protein BDD12DRAFT_859017 [Trichophaea hybrida]|nr:hypothetical protein BDD12DRAFT_859017 [Trichophaea hybrida]